MRKTQPELIITHFEKDYMNDHMQTYYSAFRASFGASIPHFHRADAGLSVPICPIYHMDTVAGVGFIPTEYVDITDGIDIKLEALSCHKSQIQWMLDHDGIDFLNLSGPAPGCGASRAASNMPRASAQTPTTYA